QVRHGVGRRAAVFAEIVGGVAPVFPVAALELGHGLGQRLHRGLSRALAPALEALFGALADVFLGVVEVRFEDRLGLGRARRAKRDEHLLVRVLVVLALERGDEVRDRVGGRAVVFAQVFGRVLALVGVFGAEAVGDVAALARRRNGAVVVIAA